jgi:FkbM family methyltransferase
MSRAPFVSYAQNHEDVVLARALRPDDCFGSWIDVGAGDPVVDSVTAAFSERGWTGINIEPLPAEHAALCSARLLDINLPVALGREPGSGKLFEGPPENRGSSTMVPEIAERYLDLGQDFAPIEVPVRTLAEITTQYAPPRVDFLKVDVEGAESDVLAGADWSTFHPRIIVVEATIPNTTIPSHGAWEPGVLAAGYELALFDGLNRFYVDVDEPGLREVLAVPANVLDDFVPHRWTSRIDEAAQRVRSMEAELEHAAERARDLDAQLAEATVRAESVDTARVEAERAARRALDHATIAEEALSALRDDLGTAQFRAARALTQTANALAHAIAAQQALDALQSTRTFRYTATLRKTYATLRRLLAPFS